MELMFLNILEIASRAFAPKNTSKIIEWIIRKINNYPYLFLFLMSAVGFKAHFLVKNYKSLFYNFCFADASVAAQLHSGT